MQQPETILPIAEESFLGEDTISFVSVLEFQENNEAHFGFNIS